MPNPIVPGWDSFFTAGPDANASLYNMPGVKTLAPGPFGSFTYNGGIPHGQSGGGVAPWIAPPLPSYGLPNYGAPSPGGQLPAMGGRAPYSPFGSRSPFEASGTGGRVSNTVGMSTASNLAPIFGQIAGEPYQPVAPPDTGGTPAQKNLINYNQYLWNLANSQNQHAFQQGAQALQGAGQSAMTDATQIADNAKALNEQNNISRGLNNSTIGATQNMGVDRELSRNLGTINEGVAQQLVNLLQSRTIKAPDAAMLAQLLMQAASNPGAAGGGPSIGVNFGGGGGNVGGPNVMGSGIGTNFLKNAFGF